jgi:hypothetical protein
MSLERTIRDTVIAESQDLDGRLQQLVRAGLMPANTIPILRKAIVKVQGGMTLQGAERDVMANFINSMMFIVLGDDAIFNRARAGAKTYATEAKEKTEYDYEGDMAMGQLKSIIANSQRMHDMLSDDTNIPEWVQSKITLAEDYISTASNYMQGEMSEETINEYAALAGVAGRMIASKLAKNAGAGVATRAIAGAAGSAAASSAVKKFSPTKETNEETIEEKRGLWDNIHAKRKRIKGGSGERMRKPGSEGAPSAADLKASQTEEVDLEEATYFVHTANNAHHVNEKIPTGKKDAMGQALMTSKVVKSFPYGDTQSKQTSPDQHKAAHAHAKKLNAGMKEEVEQVDEISSDMAYRYLRGKRERDYNISADGKSASMKKPMTYAKMNKDAKSSIRALRTIEKSKKTNEEVEQVDEISKGTMGRYINKAKDSIDMTSYRSGVKDAAGDEYKPKNPLERKLTKRHKGISMAVKKLTKEDIDAVKSMNESYKNTFDAALEHYNIKSPSELGEEKRKEFFNHVDQEFKKGDK